MPRKINPDSLPRDKVLDLYQRLMFDRRRHFQADIARQLGCSPQTVVRLVDRIERHIGADAYIERGIEGRRRFYRLVSKSRDAGLGFDFEELEYLALCRDLAAPFLPEDVWERIGQTLTTLAVSLGERAAPETAIGFKPKGRIDYAPHIETIATLRAAMAKHELCMVRYRARGRDGPSWYRYAPGRILAMNGTLYVLGRLVEADSVLPGRETTFSLHRILEIRLLREFVRFDALDRPCRSFGLAWHPPKRMQVHVARDAADYVRDRIWSEDQTIQDHADGSLSLSLTTTSEKELEAWVMSFGRAAKLLPSHDSRGASLT